MVKTAVNAEQTPKSDGLTEKRVLVKRVAKVVKGGRKFGFVALIVVGDGNGGLGIGIGKSGEVPVAIQKGMENGRKNMMRFKLRNHTFQHPIVAKYGATKVFIQPATEGTGIIAGKTMRAIFEVMGVKNVLSKTFGSSNPVNVVRATVKALQEMAIPGMIAEKRGKTLKEIWGVPNEKE
jgi:small subunit ribosomal protein S5